MNIFQVTEEGYIRDERDFLTPLSPTERLLRTLSPQRALAPQAFPTTWMPAIDISGLGQTKAIAAAFPQLVAAGWKLVIMRASIGLVPDALFDYFWHAAYDAGMYMMAYHLGLSTYSGMSQATIFLNTIDPMLAAIDGHSAGVLDVEVPGDVVAWRKTTTDFYGSVKPHLVTGEYSSVTKWLSCTNNMPVPGFAWNASWSNIVNVASFAPAIQTVLRQIGAYLKHSWVPRPPGVNEDVDVNYFMGTESDLRRFLGYSDPTPPPPPPPSDLQQQLNALAARVASVDGNLQSLDKRNENYYASMVARLVALEGKAAIQLPSVPFTLAKQMPASYFKQTDKVGKPNWIIYPSDGSPVADRKFLSGTVQVFPWPLTGTGGVQGFMVMDPWLLPGTPLWVMAHDREILA